MRGLLCALGALLAIGLLPLTSASADVSGPDESIGQAFGPLTPGTGYDGAFASAVDVDYLAFDVPQAGETLHFDLQNTVHGCTSAYANGCPVYGTLIDGQGRQLGGEGSSAGTGPVTEYYPADSIDWTFGAAGRYYVAVDSDGDLPTYSLDYQTVSLGSGGSTSGGSTSGGSTGGDSIGSGSGSHHPQPAIASLRVLSYRGGPDLQVRLDIRRALRGLTLRLEQAGAHLIAIGHFSVPRAGRRTITLHLDANARRALSGRGRLAVELRVVAPSPAGPPQILQRSVPLRR